jgi:hypothetical protein
MNLGACAAHVKADQFPLRTTVIFEPAFPDGRAAAGILAAGCGGDGPTDNPLPLVSPDRGSRGPFFARGRPLEEKP